MNFLLRIPNKYWYFIAILLMFPALLMNLNLLTILEDEAIRALVALEMYYTGDFIVPKLNGYLYFYKPPLYNWILVFFYAISGEINELIIRLPTLIFLAIFALSVYYFTRGYLGKKKAILNALFLVTCGRILFWDSMLGLIDICYSLVTYVQLMLIYYGLKRKNYIMLFVYSAFFTAIGFMLKGFPSILFQGITLISWLSFNRSIKKLFSKESIMGILIFCIVIFSYYVLYYQSEALSNSLNGLLDQSTRRTLVHEKNGIVDFFKHLLSYPFENFYHFLPWSIMIIYYFNTKLVVKAWKNSFIRFNIIIFLANILVYWTSVEVYPRYILMLVPIIFTSFLYLHRIHKKMKTLQYKIVTIFFISLFVIVIVSGIALPFYEVSNSYPYVMSMSIFISFSTLVFLYVFYYSKNNRLILMVCVLLVVRIGFNYFILNERNNADFANHCRSQAIEIGRKYKDEDFRIYKSSKIDYTSSWYISKTREKVTQHDSISTEKGVFYVIDTIKYEIPPDFKKIESFDVREFKRKLYVIKK